MAGDGGAIASGRAVRGVGLAVGAAHRLDVEDGALADALVDGICEDQL